MLPFYQPETTRRKDRGIRGTRREYEATGSPLSDRRRTACPVAPPLFAVGTRIRRNRHPSRIRPERPATLTAPQLAPYQPGYSEREYAG